MSGYKEADGVITRKILGMNPNFMSSYLLSDKEQTKPTQAQVKNGCFDTYSKRNRDRFTAGI